jgi:hypothetical protein
VSALGVSGGFDSVVMTGSLDRGQCAGRNIVAEDRLLASAE